MELEKAKEIGKKILKGSIATLALTIAVTVVVHVESVLYDHRIVLAVLAGKFGFDAAYSLLGKIKGLE